MKKRLTFKENIYVMSMLFGLFFGAGNLIFPVYMGQLAGYNVWHAVIGFLITGVTLPLFTVAAMGKSKSSSLLELSSKVSKGYGVFFTCICTLTIGPFFAIPRCATTSFTVGIAPIVGDSKLALFIFSFVFFLVAAFFSLRPSKILTWVGKILNPLFLTFLAILIVKAFVSPMGSCKDMEPVGNYIDKAFLNGFYEGYNTMDAIAGLVFGIIVVRVVKNLGITDSDDVATNTIISGITSCLLMGLIYMALAIAGAKSVNAIGLCSNGGEVLAKMAEYYFGKFGAFLLALIVTGACLKTAVGLITSISEIFASMFPGAFKLRAWTLLFLASSLTFANFGLTKIISYAVPFLMFIYPLSIVLMVLALTGNLFRNSEKVYKATIYTTIPFAVLELVKSLPFEITFISSVQNLVNAMPLGSWGLEWLIPAGAAFVISILAVNGRKVGSKR